jgi:SAM-dependent methyltransferase
VQPTVTITLERSGAWRGVAGGGKHRHTRGEPGPFTRPVRLTMRSGSVLARPRRLPLEDASVSSIACLDVLEYIRNDDIAVDEFARVLAPGGALYLRVPATGPLAGLDAYNLMHYLVDTSRRGLRPHETCEVGWRRHYGIEDLIHLLGHDRFQIVRVRRRGLAIAEVVDFAAMMLFRWLSPSQDHYRAGKRIARMIERIERRITVPFGANLDLEAVRLP